MWNSLDQKLIRSPRRVKAKKECLLQYLALEQRHLLATVSLDSGTLLVVDDTAGGVNDEITISHELGQFTVSDPALTMTSSIPGVSGNGTNSITFPDTGITNITINTVGGDDVVTIESVQDSLGDLTILGGPGDDLVNLDAQIQFANDADLQVDLTNGSLQADADEIKIGIFADLFFAGTGSATLKTNTSVTFVPGQQKVEVVDGDLVVEANAGRVNHHSVDVGIATIDNDSITSELVITDPGTIQDINVTLDINHPNASDLSVVLINPIGESIDLFSGIGGTGDNFKNTSFDDQANLDIANSTTPHSGVFRPLQELSIFNGSDLAGTWQLMISDDALGNSGILNSWSMNVMTDEPVLTTGPTGGVDLEFARIKSTGRGDIHVTGRGGAGDVSQLFGVWLRQTRIESFSESEDAGSIYLDGIGGDGTGNNWGVHISSGRVTAETGEIEIVGKGGGSADSNGGVFMLNTTITSDSDIRVAGTGGGTGSSFNAGVEGSSMSLLSSAGTTVVTGIGGGDSGGIEFFTGASVGGDVGLVLQADSIELLGGPSLSSDGDVILKPLTPGYPIDVGTETEGTLSLTTTELESVRSGLIKLGDEDSGPISVTAKITNRFFADGIQLNGNVVNPIAAGVDFDMRSKILTFASGADLNIRIDGTTVDTDYDQLGIEGQVDLTGVDLVIGGSHTPIEGEQFVVVGNYETSPIIGAFNGLPEGATISNFLGSSLNATISYTGGSGNDVVLTVVSAVATEVLGQHVFYSGSSFDDGADGAIDPTKTALLPGGVATFANYTSNVEGINGLMVDIAAMQSTPTLSTIGNYFEFKVGNDNTPGSWATAAAPTGLTVRPGEGTAGSDRIELEWGDQAIQKAWLEITVLSNSSTGLSSPYVFYFGNAPGETGNDPANAIVNLQDVALVRENQTGFGTAEVDNVFDFDRDGRVNLADVALARQNQSGFTPLQLIDLSSGRPGGGNGKPGFAAQPEKPSNNDQLVDNPFRVAIGLSKNPTPLLESAVFEESDWLDELWDWDAELMFPVQSENIVDAEAFATHSIKGFV